MSEISSTSSLNLVHNLQVMPALQATDCTVEATLILYSSKIRGLNKLKLSKS